MSGNARNESQHWRMQLNNLLQSTYGAGSLGWDMRQEGPQHSSPWVAVALVKGVEYGRGRGWQQGEAKEQAARAAYTGVYRQVYGKYPEV